MDIGANQGPLKQHQALKTQIMDHAELAAIVFKDLFQRWTALKGITKIWLLKALVRNALLSNIADRVDYQLLKGHALEDIYAAILKVKAPLLITLTAVQGIIAPLVR